PPLLVRKGAHAGYTVPDGISTGGFKITGPSPMDRGPIAWFCAAAVPTEIATSAQLMMVARFMFSSGLDCPSQGRAKTGGEIDHEKLRALVGNTGFTAAGRDVCPLPYGRGSVCGTPLTEPRPRWSERELRCT